MVFFLMTLTIGIVDRLIHAASASFGRLRRSVAQQPPAAPVVVDPVFRVAVVVPLEPVTEAEF
jgi:hypothetical protein